MNTMVQKKTILGLLIGMSALSLTGCRQEEPSLAEPDLLTVRIEVPDPDTKTSFDNVTGKASWTSGDEIALHYSDGNYYSFSVNATDGTVVASSTSSRSRNYYAVYPADAADADNYGNTTLKVTLPDSYDIRGNLTSDFSPVPMVALNTETSSVLDFYHVGGLLRINCEDVPDGTKTVVVTLDKDITGSYSVSNLSSLNTSGVSPAPTITTAGNSTDNTVTFTVSDSGLSSGTELVLNVPVPCGTYQTVRVEAFGSTSDPLTTRDFNGRPLTFERHHGKKLNVKELSFSFYLTDLTGVSVSPARGTSVLTDGFVSYKTDGIHTEKVPFSIEFMEEGESHWSSTPPDWLSLTGAIDYSGSFSGEPQTIGVSVETQVNSMEDTHADRMRSNGTARDVDLSTINVVTGTTVSTSTANCYVVQMPGTYRFPVVYGNGVKDGADNPGAYNRTDWTAGISSDYLEVYKDHLDRDISDPYIAKHLAETSPAMTGLSATLVWTDAPGLVANVAYIEDSGGDYSKDYISFEVPSETITQGNALIAVIADGIIAWSWHIWVTDEVLSAVKSGAGGYSFAPVNIGWCDRKEERYESRACQVRIVQDVSGNASTFTVYQEGKQIITSGNSPFYQWGRKDPIAATIGNENKTKTYYPTAANYAPQGVSGQASLGTSIQQPTCLFFRRSEDDVVTAWCSNPTLNNWNSAFPGVHYTVEEHTVTKTIYDPSPCGFRVPHLQAFAGFYYNDDTDNNIIWCPATSTMVAGAKFIVNDLFFPGCGYAWGPNDNGGIRYFSAGTRPYYWAADATNLIRAQNVVFDGSYEHIIEMGFYFPSKSGCSVIPILDPDVLP